LQQNRNYVSVQDRAPLSSFHMIP